MDIYQINHAIDKIENECEFLDDVTRKTYLGQLYGLRAFYYFHLLRTWGGVPLCDKPDVLITDDLQVLDKPRATEQATWEFVCKSVEKSCEYYQELGFDNFKESEAGRRLSRSRSGPSEISDGCQDRSRGGRTELQL